MAISSATAVVTPTQALRDSVRAMAIPRAGMTSADHSRSRRAKSSRAVATPITSINRPE